MVIENEVHGLRPNANMVLSLLQKERRALSAYEILNRLLPEGVHAPATVYRSLEALIRKGLVRKIQTYSRYVLVSEEMRNGRALPFVICKKCGKIFNPPAIGLQKDLEQTGHEFLGQIDQITLEIAGICTPCLEKKNCK